MDACERMGMFPIMMELLPASQSSAIEESLKMVDMAELYVGIFAWRYGYVPTVTISQLRRWSITARLSVASRA